MMAMPESTPATATATNPADGHIKVVAILNFIFGGLAALTGLAIMMAFGIGSAAVGANQDYGAPAWVANMLASMAFIFGILFACAALIHILAGAHQLNHKRSGKTLGIFAAVLLLIVNIPLSFGGIGLIGLAAAIYMLVILSRQETDQILVN
jgi:hypothetical protein